MKLLSFLKLALLPIAVCVAAVGCGGDDDVVIDPCAPVAAPTPASGASAPVSATGGYLCGAGVGVSDLNASAAFYKTAFAMKERARIKRADRDEVVLDSADGRGSRLVLMHFTDGSVRNYKRNPGKIVFNIKDMTAIGAAFALAKGVPVAISTPTPIPATGTPVVTVSFGRDPDGNLIELNAYTTTTTVHSYISAFGIGVSDLQAARDFYVGALNMPPDASFGTNGDGFYVARKATGPWYEEYILTSGTGRGSAIVLMKYNDVDAAGAPIPHNYANNPIKLTLRANDPVAYAARISAAGKTVTTVPAPGADPFLGLTTVGFAKDGDGTVLEILNSPY